MHKRPTTLAKKATALAKELGIDGPMNHEHFDKYAEKYKRKVFVYGDRSTWVYKTPDDIAQSIKNCVHICWDSENSHYHLITNIQAFLSNGDSNYRYCEPCMKMVKKTDWITHYCVALQCCRCRTRFKTQEELDLHKSVHEQVKCEHCNNCFHNQECYDKHISNKICELKQRCEKCNENIKPEKFQKLTPERIAEHQCGEKWCDPCQ